MDRANRQPLPAQEIQGNYILGNLNAAGLVFADESCGPTSALGTRPSKFLPVIYSNQHHSNNRSTTPVN
jgi:hypothetical protein